MHTHQCDHCGTPLTHSTASAVLVGVALALERPQTVHDMFGNKTQIPAKEEFEFCPECALALLIALKSRKLELQKTGRVVPQ